MSCLERRKNQETRASWLYKNSISICSKCGNKLNIIETSNNGVVMSYCFHCETDWTVTISVEGENEPVLTEKDLYPVVDEILYGRYNTITVVMPTLGRKKEVGPMLGRVLDEAGIPYKFVSTHVWKTFAEKIRKIEFVTKIPQHAYSSLVIVR